MFDVLTTYTGSRVNTEICVALDLDDPTLAEYVHLFSNFVKSCEVHYAEFDPESQIDLTREGLYSYTSGGNVIHLSIGPRIKMCPTVNRVYNQLPHFRYYFFMGDDHRLRTSNATNKLAERIEEAGGYAVAYGDDMMMHETLASAFLVPNTLIKLQGGYIPHPDLIHMYMDNQMMDLGRATGGLIYAPDVFVEHMHYTQGKSEKDAQYEEVNASPVFQHDEAVYRNWKENLLPDIVKKYKEEYGI